MFCGICAIVVGVEEAVLAGEVRADQVVGRPKAANVANTQNTLMSAWCGQHSWYVVQCTIFTHVVTVHSWPDHVLPTILSQKPTLPITYDIAANMLTASLLGVRSPCGQNRLLVYDDTHVATMFGNLVPMWPL